MSPSSSATIRAANAAYLSLLRGEGDGISEYFSPEYTAHLTERTLTGGHALVRSVAARFRTAFTDLSLEVEVLVEGADRVAWQRVCRGIHTGALHGFPGSGREIVWRDMVTTRLEEGRIAEEWVISDLAERLLLSRKPS
jgi:predicted ester cyclase